MKRFIFLAIFFASSAANWAEAQTSTQTQALNADYAYKYVTNICHSFLPITHDELQSMRTALLVGLRESLFNVKGFANRMQSQDRLPEELKVLIESDGFIRGVYACHPKSELLRNLLALRVITLNSAMLATGDVLGFFAVLKAFSFTAKILGSSTLVILRYLGFSEAAIIWFKRLGLISGVAVVGSEIYNDYGDVIRLYFKMSESEDQNSKEIKELKSLKEQITEEIKTTNDKMILLKLQGDLEKVGELISKREHFYEIKEYGS
ncbi:MAG TPA: hypothetical protein VN132_04760 [Bdellovibrio sp.]|nr:hypothetical protein [Bdellovibrio sp.]